MDLMTTHKIEGAQLGSSTIAELMEKNNACRFSHEAQTLGG